MAVFYGELPTACKECALKSEYERLRDENRALKQLAHHDDKTGDVVCLGDALETLGVKNDSNYSIG